MRTFPDIYEDQQESILYTSTFLAQMKMRYPELAARGGRLLDVGCGKGHFLTALQERAPQFQAYGIDLDSRILGEAAQKKKTIILRGDCEHLPFVNGSFDIITSRGLLDYADTRPKPKAIFPTTITFQNLASELYRVLKQGGFYYAFEAADDTEKGLLVSVGFTPAYRAIFLKI